MQHSKDIIKKSVLKIVVISIIVGLNWAGISAIGETFAYFSDTKISTNNTIQTGVLDMTLRSGQNNFVPPEIASNMGPGDSVARDIYIKKEGGLTFKYKARSEAVSGNCDLDFYDVLELKVWYNYYTALPELPNYHEHRTMTLKYSGLLKDFNDFNTNSDDPDLRIPSAYPYFDNVFYGPSEHWLYFQITLPSTWTENNKSCQFKFVFDSWQVSLPDSSFGFSDTEEIYSSLIDSVFAEEESTIENSNIVINEFLPIAGNYPEFIEFYNKGDTSLDITNWIIENKDTTIIINQNILYAGATNTIIEPEKWLVIDLSKVGEDILDDIGDIITLYDSENNEIDTISYAEASIVDKSYARIPDGSSNWFDPIPTPGAPNQLNEEEIKELELEPEAIPESESEEVIELEEVSEEESIEAEVITEENQEQGGIIEEINEIIDEVIDEIVDEIMPDETTNEPAKETLVAETVGETGDEVVSEAEAPIIEDVPIIEEVPADETLAVDEQPATEEQPAAVPDNNYSGQPAPASDNGSGGDNGSTNSGETNTGGGDSGGSPATDASGSNGDSGAASVSE